MTDVLPTSFCPWCGYQVDAATCATDQNAKPRPGDLSMCLKCLSFLQFGDDLRLVALPDAAFHKLDDELRFKYLLRRMRRLVGPIPR